MDITELAKFRGVVSVDTITELTSDSGVTVDGMLIKDGKTSSNNISWQEPTMFRNRIINGGFDIWQRGTTPGTMAASTQAGEYVSADRWKVGAVSFSVGYNFVSLTQLSTGLPTGVKFAGKVTSTAAGTDAICIGQYIESANSYSLVGQKLTVSMKLKKLAGFDTGTQIGISVFSLGTADTASTNMEAPAAGGCTLQFTTNHTLTTSDWETVTVTSSSVMPAAAANGLLLHIYYAKTDMGASEKFAVAQVQLEPGTVATPFEFRPYGTELALCQRYFYRPGFNTSIDTSSIMNFAMGASWLTTMADILIPFPVQMRDWPVLGKSPTIGNLCVLNTGSGALALTGLVIQTNSTVGPTLRATVAGGLTVGAATMLARVNINGYIDFSAEL